MSQSFRAVKEIWNMHSPCFVEPEKLIVLLPVNCPVLFAPLVTTPVTPEGNPLNVAVVDPV